MGTNGYRKSPKKQKLKKRREHGTNRVTQELTEGVFLREGIKDIAINIEAQARFTRGIASSIATLYGEEI